MSYKYPDVSELIGKKLKSFRVANDELYIETECGKKYTALYHQSCCECVYIHDVQSGIGGIDAFLESPIEIAQESSCGDWPDDVPVMKRIPDSYTWSTYYFSSDTGFVRVRWFGESNGYYSEGVSFEEI